MLRRGACGGLTLRLELHGRVSPTAYARAYLLLARVDDGAGLRLDVALPKAPLRSCKSKVISSHRWRRAASAASVLAMYDVGDE
jgi:hypothetical protein